jgi:hypothetical protein
MAYLASELLVKALRTSGLVSADIGNQPTSRQMVDALDLLNEILSQINSDGALLPYTSTISVDMVAGQETYEIDNLIQWQAIAYYLDDIRYTLYYSGRTDYYSSNRADNILSMPYQFHVERTIGGSKIQLYFFPQQDYPLEITGLFGFSPVGISDDISTLFDTYYLKYLRLKLANAICSYNELTLSNGSAIELAKIEKQMKRLNNPDLSSSVVNLMTGANFPSYAQANFRNGFQPT